MTIPYKLSNGDVISLYNDLYEFEDGLLYQVIEDKIVFPGHWKYKRISEGLTPKQVNEKYNFIK